MVRRPHPTAATFVNVMSRPVGWLSRMLLDAEFSGREHVPTSGPFVFAANHLSLVDPVFMTAAVERLIHFLAVDELFDNSRILDQLMYYFGTIPMSRERPPLGALKRALELLEAGEAVGVFPEGARAAYWGERSIRRGAAWLALATNSPIVPCAVTGTEATMSLRNPGVRIPSIRISLHPPIYPVSYTDMEDPLGAMMEDWKAALDEQLNHWQPG